MFITKKKFMQAMADLYSRFGFDMWELDGNLGGMTENSDKHPVTKKEFKLLLKHLGLESDYSSDGFQGFKKIKNKK